MHLTRLNSPEVAFSLIANFVAEREPFASGPFGPLVRTVAGCVRRAHYVLAVDENRLVGVLCWAVTSRSVAEAWVSAGDSPPEDAVRDGDTVVVLIGSAETDSVVRAGFKRLAQEYPGRLYVLRRHGRSRHSHGRLRDGP